MNSIFFECIAGFGVKIPVIVRVVVSELHDAALFVAQELFLSQNHLREKCNGFDTNQELF